jgi:hypothetical protein
VSISLQDGHRACRPAFDESVFSVREQVGHWNSRIIGSPVKKSSGGGGLVEALNRQHNLCDQVKSIVGHLSQFRISRHSIDNTSRNCNRKPAPPGGATAAISDMGHIHRPAVFPPTRPLHAQPWPLGRNGLHWPF